MRHWPATPPVADDVVARAEQICAGRWTYVGECHDLGALPDWTSNPSADKEWQIAWHKHYFTFELVQAYESTGEVRYLHQLGGLLASWLDQMGQGWITTSDAQVEAKRVESWLIMLTLLDRSGGSVHLEPELLDRLIERLGVEARYIAANLKRHRNHRTFQLWSVFAVGVLFPELDDASELHDSARALLTANLLDDLGDDGVQVEGSTHYHQLVTETALSFAELCADHGLAFDPELRRRLRLALEYCAWFQWPDGNIPLINDADDGRHDHLLSRGAALFGEPIERHGLDRDFAAFGYAIFTAPDRHLFVDLARMGDGSHAHYDLGSFTYWADGAPRMVDPGRYTYSSLPDTDGVDWRHHFKSTAAHNTVQIDGLDQARYLNRTKRGPDPWLEERLVELNVESPWAFGRIRSHEYDVAHERCIVFVDRRYVVIIDRVQALDRNEHLVEVRFHLPVNDDVAVISTVPLTREDDWVAPLYGVKYPAAVMVGRTRSVGVTIVSAVAHCADGPLTVTAGDDGFVVRSAAGMETVVRHGTSIAGRWELA
jgi:hypothetical protein